MKKNLKTLIVFLIVCTIALGGAYFRFHYAYNDGVFTEQYQSIYYLLCVIISGWITYMLKDIL